VQIGTDTGPGGGGGGGGTTAPATAATDAMAPMGANCGTDPTGAVVLCEQISLCPGVAVDPGAFPNCGFRLGAAASLDIECVCGSALCPIGVPQTCGQAAQLLAAQSSLVVCQQASLGSCIALGADASGSSSCDRACANSCAGAPDCLVFCGC
jgi:hypothetical protein